MGTWHNETENTVHSDQYMKLENYFEELQQYSWISVPDDQRYQYAIERDCDLTCSEECLSLSGLVETKVIDACNSEKCNCYYSEVKDWDPCNNDCKRACLLEDDIEDCLENSCLCEEEDNPFMSLRQRDSHEKKSKKSSHSKNKKSKKNGHSSDDSDDEDTQERFKKWKEQR